MQIILLKDVSKVGRKAEIVTVSEGYALNFLIPKGLAKSATPAALRELESQKSKLAAEQATSDAELREHVEAINGKTLTLHVRANEQGHLFAAIHKNDVSTAVYDQLGVGLPEAAVMLHESIKTTGKLEVEIHGGGGKAKLHVVVEALDEK